MKHEDQIKLQAFLDGELPEREAREVRRWVESDQESAALLAELRCTNESLRHFESELRVPESREFYWSKIERELARPARTEAGRVSWLDQLRRLLMPATSVAVIALFGLLLARQFTGPGSGAMAIETTLEDTGLFTYHDYSAGATLVWVSYPAEDDVAPNHEPDTLE